MVDYSRGPWEVDGNDYRDEAQQILDAHGCVIAEAYTQDRTGVVEANSALIAAAPCLLAACQALLSIIPPVRSTNRLSHDAINATQDAIARALGTDIAADVTACERKLTGGEG